MSQLINPGAHPLPSVGNNTIHLGDGAYAQWDGYSMLLYASNCEYHSRPVHLDSHAIQAFIRYARSLYGPLIVPQDPVSTHENEQSEIISPDDVLNSEKSADSVTHDATRQASDYDILTDLDIGPEREDT